MCCGSNADRWVVTYPATPATDTTAAVESRTEEFLTVRDARTAAEKVPNATYDRKSANAAT
jgi:hypothetical protein